MSAIRPGVIAQIVHPSLWGKVVEVLYLAPAHDFILPDDYRHKGCPGGNTWVCESMGTPFPAPIARDGSHRRQAMFAAIDARWLKPLPGLDDDTPAKVVHELPLDAFGEPA
jgi:hypothetical protein